MPALPKVVLSVVIILFTLSTLTLTSPAFAQPSPPDPQPCKNALETEKLTDNYLEPLEFSVTRTGEPDEEFPVTETITFTVDFSKLQAIFGATNSNYQEARFQDESHRSQDILGLKSQDFNIYHGAGQKAAPKVMVDELKVNYVTYVYNKPTLAESANKYTDIENKEDPKTIYDLVTEFGLPDPPEANENKTPWLATWGRYWEKIPTAYNEFYEGRLEFRSAAGKENFKKIENGELCPLPIRIIKFVMPEFFRTTAISNQLNQIIVPKAAQSYDPTLLASTTQVDKNIFSAIIKTCLKPITAFSKILQKTLKMTLDFLKPVKTAYAAETPPCIKIPQKGKEGEAPFCALPAGQLQPGDSCTNKDDSNKLDKDNPNVVCTFSITWTGTIVINPNDPNLDCTDNKDGTFTCTLKVRIWPVFRIPWLSEIWNKTFYSDELEGTAGAGVGSEQKTGRPGIYSAFIPQGVANQFLPPSPQQLEQQCKAGNQNACKQITEEINQCLKLPGLQKLICLAKFLSRNLPGKVSQATGSNNPKERFIGATDCGKEIVRDMTLKPKALQEALGIEQACKTSDSSL